MKKIQFGAVVVATALLSSQAFAGDLVVVRGMQLRTLKPGETVHTIVDEAKQESLRKLPHEEFDQVSKWRVGIVNGPYGQNWHWASAEAAFRPKNEAAPWYVAASARTFIELGPVGESDLERAKSEAKKLAAFYCNSEVSESEGWETKVITADGWTREVVEGRFQCIEMY